MFARTTAEGKEHEMFGDVVVPLDGSPEAVRSLGPAGAIAHYLDSTVRVVAVDRGEEGFADRVEAQLVELGDARRHLEFLPAGGSVEDRLREVISARPGSLVLMASHGADAGDTHPGVAAGLLDQTVSPVVLVGPEFASSRFRCHGPLVVALDDDPHAQAIVPVAEAFAIVLDFDLELVTVGDPSDDAETVAAQEALLGGLAQQVADTTGDAVGWQRLVGADVVETIVGHAAACRAALVAMATHGVGDDPAMALGSTTLAVVRHAPCPVLAMRPAVIHR